MPALKADETASSSSLISLASLELPRLGLRMNCEVDGSWSVGVDRIVNPPGMVFDGSMRI